MPHYHFCAQRSDEWHDRRRNVVCTASEAGDVMARARFDPKPLLCKRIGQRLLSRSLDGSVTAAMQRGIDNEPDAVKQFSRITGLGVRQVGFITTDDERFGCSPDGLIIGEHEGLEIKCREVHHHVRHMLKGATDEYYAQLQMQCWVADLRAVHFYAYHPELPPGYERVLRDEGYIAKLVPALFDFAARFDAALETAQQKYERFWDTYGNNWREGDEE